MAIELVLVLVVLILFVAILVPWIIALVDALRRPDGEWALADQNKLVWVVLIVVTGVVGAVLYLAIARPALNRARNGAVGLS